MKRPAQCLQLSWVGPATCPQAAIAKAPPSVPHARPASWAAKLERQLIPATGPPEWPLSPTCLLPISPWETVQRVTILTYPTWLPAQLLVPAGPFPSRKQVGETEGLSELALGLPPSTPKGQRTHDR